jgi:hypothetical protein
MIFSLDWFEGNFYPRNMLVQNVVYAFVSKTLDTKSKGTFFVQQLHCLSFHSILNGLIM